MPFTSYIKTQKQFDEDREQSAIQEIEQKREQEVRNEKLQICFGVVLVILFVIGYYLFKKRKMGIILNKLKVWENKSFNFIVNEIFQPSRMFWITIFVGIIIFFYTRNSLQNVLLFAVAMIVLWNTREIYLKNKRKDE